MISVHHTSPVLIPKQIKVMGGDSDVWNEIQDNIVSKAVFVEVSFYLLVLHVSLNVCVQNVNVTCDGQKT